MTDRRPLDSLTIEQQPEPVVLAMLLAGEARGEQDRSGRLESVAMLAVGWVAYNRANDTLHRWAKTPGAAALQTWQFSCFNFSDPNRAKLLTLWKTDPGTWERADTVLDLLASGYATDPTGGATHYCTEALWGTDDAGRIALGKRARWFSIQEISAGRTVRLVQKGHHIFGRAA